jgi:hypothetical protein
MLLPDASSGSPPPIMDTTCTATPGRLAVRRFVFALAAMVILAAGTLGAAAARQQAFDPDAAITALLSAALPGRDSYWTEAIQRARPDAGTGQLHRAELEVAGGLIVFEIYQDEPGAEAALVREGTELIIDEAAIAGASVPESSSASIVQQQAPNLLGTSLWTAGEGDGAVSCGLARNVIVCGFSDNNRNPEPGGPAAIAAINGLALLYSVVPPPPQANVAPPVQAVPAEPDADDPGDGPPRRRQQEEAPAPAQPVEPAVEAPGPVSAPAVVPGGASPSLVVPGGMNAPGPVAYRLELAGKIELDLFGKGANRPAAGYTVDEVRWILAHPTWIDGVPYRAVVDELARTATSLVSRYPDPQPVAARLVELGWQDGYQRIFALDGPPPGIPGYVDITASRFASVDGASSAARHLAGLLSASGLAQVPYGPAGNAAFAFTGPEVNGTQHAVVVAAGGWLITVTAVAPAGDPAPTADAIVRFMLATAGAGAG